MRIILFTGKGGAGKTSLSAATGLELASRGQRTLVMSVDPAHSLSDSFNIQERLLEGAARKPMRICNNLWIREVDLHDEIRQYWGAIEEYIGRLLNLSGLQALVADELAVLPGMEDITALLCLKQHCDENEFDVIVLDCAPTAESLRFVAIPATVDWYMKRVFGLDQRVARLVRPLSNSGHSVLPTESYFENFRKVHQKLRGIDSLLMNRRITTVRLVTNPETVVVRETQRAFTYFCLSGMTVDAVIVNRLLPLEVAGRFFSKWKSIHDQWLPDIEKLFAPVPVFRVPLSRDELCGMTSLRRVGRSLYEGVEPMNCLYDNVPYRFRKRREGYEISIETPFIRASDIEVRKRHDELIVSMGSVRRHILLPARLAGCDEITAAFEEGRLRVCLRESSHGG
jgi:arsenite-transporting ATPase